MSLNASGVRDTARSLHICPNTVLRELKKKAAVLESVNTSLHVVHWTRQMVRTPRRTRR
jgi:InsA C-terminal domain